MRNKSKVVLAPKSSEPLNIASFLPGLRGGASWHVRAIEEGEIPHTMNATGVNGVMAVPVDGSARSQFIKLHELLHAAHSPLERPRSVVTDTGIILDRQNILMSEEFRINLVGRWYVGSDLPDQDADLAGVVKRLIQLAAENDFEDIVELIHYLVVIVPLLQDMMYAQTWIKEIFVEVSRERKFWTTPNGPTLMSIVPVILVAYVDEWADEIDALYTKGTFPTWDSVLKHALWLQHQLERLEVALDGDPNGSGEGEATPDPDLEQLLENAEFRVGSNPQRSEHEGVEDIRHELLKNMFKKAGEVPERPEHAGKPRWGKMTMRTANFTKRIPGKLLARSKFKGSDEGTTPRYIHRLPLDRKIFGRKKRSPGGSVLIDDSGSMGFETADIDAIMRAAPAVTVAAYSARYSMSGELVILGQDGKFADVTADPTARPDGSNNLVDYPALQWLAEQPKPRIWVSDTQITLEGGSLREAYMQVYEICRDKQINIVPDVEAARAVFEGKREIYR